MPTWQEEPEPPEDDCKCGKSTNAISKGPVKYSSGAVVLSETDLASNGFGIPWGHTRSYSNLNTDNAQGLNGSSWMLAQLKTLVFSGSGPGGLPATVCVVDGPITSLWFKLNGSGEYEPSFNSLYTLQHDDDPPGDELPRFVLTSPEGETWWFGDHTLSAVYRGKPLRVLDAAGNAAELAYDMLNGTLKSFVQTSGGQSAGYYYQCADVDTGVTRIESVTLRLDGNDVRRVWFSYYSGIEDGGEVGDLRLSNVEEWDRGSGVWRSVRKSHYRYYSYEDVTGFPHGLKFVLRHAAFAQMQAAGLDPLLATEAELASFADYYYEYDTERRVNLERINGGRSEFTFEYVLATPGSSSSSVDQSVPNIWTTQTTEARPDGSVKRIYSNIAGQTILEKLSQPSASKG